MREIARLYMDVVYLEMMLSQITYRTFNVGSVSLFLAQIHSLLENPEYNKRTTNYSSSWTDII